MENKIVLIGFILMILISCEPYDNRLTIKNKSDHKIYIMFNSNETDTTWYSSLLNDIGKKNSFINPDSLLKLGMIGNYEQEARNSPNEKSVFWFIKAEFLIKYRDKHIADTSLYKKKAYTYKELQNMNWLVEYP